MSDMGLLEAQARGGIEGVNAYAEAQAEVARRRKAAVDAAVAAATGRGAPQAAIDEIAAATQQPFDMAQNAMTQQSANFDADAARRTGRWNAYARDVQATRGLVGEQAASRASIIDADTKAKLALLEAQQRASMRGSGGGGRGGGGGGGGSNTSDAKKPTQTELANTLKQLAAGNLQSRAARGQLMVDERSEVRRFANQSRTMNDRLSPQPRVDRAAVDARVQRQVTAPTARNTARQQGAVNMRNAAAAALARFTQQSDQMLQTVDSPVLRAMVAGRQVPDQFRDRMPALQSMANQYMDARDVQRIANRVGNTREAVPMSERTIRAQEQQRVTDAFNRSDEGRAAQATRAALERSIAEGLRQAQLNATQGSRDIAAFYDPMAYQQEQVNVATSDPVLSGLIDQYDLAGALDMSGDSAATIVDQMRGGPQAREAEQLQQQAALDAQKTDEQRQRDQLSNMLGVDVEQLATATKVPVQALSSLLLNSDVQQALNMASQAAMTVQDDDLYNADIRAIMAAASSDDVRRLIRVYADLLR